MFMRWQSATASFPEALHACSHLPLMPKGFSRPTLPYKPRQRAVLLTRLPGGRTQYVTA